MSSERSARQLGGSCCQFCGRYDKYCFTVSRAASSVLTRTLPDSALTGVDLRATHRLEGCLSPVTISTMRSDPRYMEAFPSTMTTMSQNAGM